MTADVAAAIVEPHTLWLFALASIALAVVPGPAVLYIVAQSVYGGRRAGVVSALGIASGGFVHLIAAVVGLSALLAASATAFTAVKVAGGLYLIYLGVRVLARKPAAEEIGGRRKEATLGRTYRQGVVVNILNPKTALFFLAFLPQFVDPDSAARPQLALLGALFVVIALSSDLAWGLAAGSAGEVLRRSRRFLALQRWVSGVVFIALGVTALFTGHRPSSSS